MRPFFFSAEIFLKRAAIEFAITHGLGNVAAVDGFPGRQVRNSSGALEQAAVRPGGEGLPSLCTLFGPPCGAH